MKNAITAALAFIVGALIIFFVVVVATANTARATWKPEYASQPQEVQDWYRNQELTPAAQKRFPFKNCCDHSDVVQAKFAVSKINGADQWFYQVQGGPWQMVPDDIIHWGVVAPGGQATLFVFQGQPTCFYPPEGGL